jgi:hypothetical protein
MRKMCDSVLSLSLLVIACAIPVEAQEYSISATTPSGPPMQTTFKTLNDALVEIEDNIQST